MPVVGRSFVMGGLAGIALTLSLGAKSAPVPREAPVAVEFHRFDMKAGAEARFDQWMGLLHRRHRDAVATLTRERTYFEAIFTAPDQPGRLYWITVQGSGGAPVESSTLDLDRQHRACMDAVLVKGSHRRLITRNVLAPDFIVKAIADDQARETG